LTRVTLLLELRGDKCRDLKNESITLKFEKQNCNLFHLSKNVARASPIDEKKNIFRPTEVIDFWARIRFRL